MLILTLIDIIQVSAGNGATPEWICQSLFMKKAVGIWLLFLHNPKTIFPVSGSYRHTDPLIHPHPAFSAFPPVLSGIQTVTPLDSTLDEVVDAVNLSTVNF